MEDYGNYNDYYDKTFFSPVFIHLDLTDKNGSPEFMFFSHGLCGSTQKNKMEHDERYLEKHHPNI